MSEIFVGESEVSTPRSTPRGEFAGSVARLPAPRFAMKSRGSSVRSGSLATGVGAAGRVGVVAFASEGFFESGGTLEIEWSRPRSSDTPRSSDSSAGSGGARSNEKSRSRESSPTCAVVAGGFVWASFVLADAAGLSGVVSAGCDAGATDSRGSSTMPRSSDWSGEVVSFGDRSSRGMRKVSAGSRTGGAGCWLTVGGGGCGLVVSGRGGEGAGRSPPARPWARLRICSPATWERGRTECRG